MRRLVGRAGRYGEALALVAVGGATGVFGLVGAAFGHEEWAVFYLLLIVLIARVGGTRAGVTTAVLSFVAWNYFFVEPVRTLTLDYPKDWGALAGFLLVGVLIGIQTGHMRERETAALARERETALLNRLSASLVSVSSTPAMVAMVLQGTRDSVNARDVVLFLDGPDARVDRLDGGDGPVADAVAAGAAWVRAHRQAIGLPRDVGATQLQGGAWPTSVAAQGVDIAVPRHALFLPIQTAATVEGVLYVAGRRDGRPYTAPERQLLVAISNLVAAFRERQRLEATAFAGETRREVDRLKSTLISSVSHELKTPLAAINATVTNLLAQDVAWQPATMQQELRSIHEAAGRLSESIGALVDLSRLEAEVWQPRRNWYELEEVLGAAVKPFARAQRRRLSFALPDDLPPFHVDFQQWTRAVHHVVENALLYAPESSPVTVGAEALPAELLVWVEDAGPGIPPAERGRIFERFYRGAGARSVPTGTGLGLAIAAEIVREHQGRIWVEDVAPHGARFVIALPRHEEQEDTHGA